MSLPITTGPLYFNTTADADAIAATMVALVLYPTATDEQKANVIPQACYDIDKGERWQGRMFVFDQGTEFPRAAYDSSRRSLVGYGPVGPAGFGIGDTVWDWDYVNNVAIVPNDVYMAIIYQADAILQGNLETRRDQMHEGVRAQGTGPLREDYAKPAASVETVLCRRAWNLMKRYTLSSGRIM